MTETLLIPLFPHYAMSSYETAVVRVQEVAAKLAPGMTITVQPPYYNHPDFIAALVASSAELLKQDYDHLLFSYHGIPERHLRKSDPTGCHCLRWRTAASRQPGARDVLPRAMFATTREFVKLAGHSEGQVFRLVSIASRQRPVAQTVHGLRTRPPRARGRKRMMVICPAFVADCLETIEEIGMRGCEDFLAASGKEFTRIPCMNEHPLWIKAFGKHGEQLRKKP